MARRKHYTNFLREFYEQASNEPELIGEILKRVFKTLETQYQSGARPSDPRGDSLQIPGAPSLAGGEKDNGKSTA